MRTLAYIVCLVLPLLASARAETESETKEPVRKSVSLSGQYAQALVAVTEQRAKDRSLSKTERDLANFEIVIAELDAKLLEVDFLPHKSGDDEVWNRSGNTSLGRAMGYGVRRRDFHVEFVKFFK